MREQRSWVVQWIAPQQPARRQRVRAVQERPSVQPQLLAALPRAE
ncbi:MAG TPA: hypothetical protein VFM39_06165 [bacterium]|nr:hypothetical protein [bacterium]